MTETGARTYGGRLVHLEAARGLAALIVLFHHFTLGFAPSWRDALEGTPAFFLLNGTGAVIFFFVLSGFVLTTRFFDLRSGKELSIGLVKRLPRLYLSPAISILVGFAILFWDARDYVDAAALSHSKWLRDFGNAQFPSGFHPSIIDALRQTISVFFSGDTYYNTNLWTMNQELLGSYVAFAVAVLFSVIGRRRFIVVATVMLIASAAFHDVYLVPFIVGVLLSYLYSRQRLPRAWVAFPTLVVGILLLAYEKPIGIFGSIEGVIAHSQVDELELATLIQTAGAASLMIALLASTRMAAILSGQWARILGRYSFPLYVVQPMVLTTASSSAYLALARRGIEGDMRNVLTLAATVLAVIFAATIFVGVEAFWVPLITKRAVRLVGEPTQEA